MKRKPIKLKKQDNRQTHREVHSKVHNVWKKSKTAPKPLKRIINQSVSYTSNIDPS